MTLHHNILCSYIHSSRELCVRFVGCCSILQTGNITLSSTPDQQLQNHSTKYHRQQPPYNTLELLMMGIVVPETCWASNKICNKKTLLHLVGILFPHIKVFPVIRKKFTSSLLYRSQDFQWYARHRVLLCVSTNIYIYIQGGSNMTGTDLCVNKTHCAAAVRPWESEATTSTLPPARARTCSVLSGSC